MEIQFLERDHGLVLSLEDRVDVFSFEDVKKQISHMVNEQRESLAVDLSKTSFLSLKTIKYLSSLAEDLLQRNGRLALIAPTEKMKRQIDIFGSIESMDIYKSQEAWGQACQTKSI